MTTRSSNRGEEEIYDRNNPPVSRRNGDHYFNKALQALKDLPCVNPVQNHGSSSSSSSAVDTVAAAGFLEKATQLGHADACYLLAVLHREGESPSSGNPESPDVPQYLDLLHRAASLDQVAFCLSRDFTVSMRFVSRGI